MQLINPQLHLTDCHTRLPFRFGIHTFTSAPLATLQVEIELSDGQRSKGASSDLLVPKWFEKNPNLTPEQDSQHLADSVKKALSLAEALSPMSLFDCWHSLYQDQVESQSKDKADLLVRGFGIAMLERATMDALCRAENLTFHQAVSKNLFGFDPGRIHPKLQKWDLAESLPPKPKMNIHLRHTIGLLDALTQSDLAEADDPQDGLPTTLEEDIKHYGLRWFKIKINGQGDADVQRLLQIAEVLKKCNVKNPQFTLDGNEQFPNMDALAHVLEGVAAQDLGREFLKGLAFIEQPLSRQDTFRPELHSGINRVQSFAPVLVDEADFGAWSFPDAVELGYRGISVKACKGVFRAFLNRGLCDQSSGNLFQSGEDLTNLPVRALQQDLCLMASLGMKHVERNGHHYFRGLHHLPSNEAEAALQLHPDLYQRNGDDIVLAIQEGRLSLASLQSPGFGCRLDP